VSASRTRACCVGGHRPHGRTDRHNRRGQRQADGFGELDASDGEVPGRRDLPLAHVRQVHVDREDIRFGDEADLASGTRTLAIALCRSHGCVRGSHRRLELQNAHERLRCQEAQVLARRIPHRRGNVALQCRRLHAEPRQASVVERLLKRHGRACIGDGIGMIERRNCEICGGESPLREQRTEDVDRLVAALHRLGQVDSRPEPGLRALDTRVRLLDRRRERPSVWGFSLCALDSFLEGQGRLCKGGVRPSNPHNQHSQHDLHQQPNPRHGVISKLLVHGG
jgi:hypothetical protein